MKMKIIKVKNKNKKEDEDENEKEVVTREPRPKRLKVARKNYKEPEDDEDEENEDDDVKNENKKEEENDNDNDDNNNNNNDDNNNNKINMQKEHVETMISMFPKNYKLRSNKIACFDLDHTLICPKTDAKFPKNRSDWKWMFPQVPKKLQELYEKGFEVFIFTNQAGIAAGLQKENDVTLKLIDIINEISVPMIVTIATDKDNWRKPNSKMFDYCLTKYFENNMKKINTAESFYCGDAAGRPKAWKNKETKKRF